MAAVAQEATSACYFTRQLLDLHQRWNMLEPIGSSILTWYNLHSSRFLMVQIFMVKPSNVSYINYMQQVKSRCFNEWMPSCLQRIMTICTRRKNTIDKVLYPLLPIEILKFNKHIHPRSTCTQDCVENACIFSVGCFKSSETWLALKPMTPEWLETSGNCTSCSD